MATKDKKFEAVISPFPVNTLDAYHLATESLYNDLWNLMIDEINADMPADWAIGVLERVKTEIQALDYEEE